MSKKIRKKDLLKRLEAVEKWQREKDEAERQKLMDEVSRLTSLMNMVPIFPREPGRNAMIKVD